MTKFPVITCRECAQTDEACYGMDIGNKMVSRSLCFTCLFWMELIESKGNPENVVVAGRHYVIGPEKPYLGMIRGFGGSLFTIMFFDGNVVETRNLWTQGDIPARFRDRLPDTATFRK